MAGRRGFVLCADDYALTEGISRGIVELLALGRLSATSVMTNRPGWPTAWQALQPFEARADLGLHITLTLGAPLGPLPLLAPDGRLPSHTLLVARAVAGKLDRAEVQAEIGRQLDRFRAIAERWPDHVDGHQHVHTLPIVRDALLAALLERELQGKLYLRDPNERMIAIGQRRVQAAKAMAIAALAKGFAQRCNDLGFAVNHGFSGVSAFDPAAAFSDDMQAALTALGPRPLVMCHPGHVDAELADLDPAVGSRANELAYLKSQEFTDLLDRRGLRIARFAELLP
jgi:hypothetical protein